MEVIADRKSRRQGCIVSAHSDTPRLDRGERKIENWELTSIGFNVRELAIAGGAAVQGQAGREPQSLTS